MYRVPNLRSSVIHGRVPTAILPVARRMYATQPPPGQASPNPKVSPSTDGGGHNNGLIIASAVAALGGMYYFYNRDRGNQSSGEKTSSGELWYCEGRLSENPSGSHQSDWIRQKVDESLHDLTERARQTAHEAQEKLNQYKNATEQTLADARRTSEQKFEETKHGPKDAGQTWFSWGQSKTDEAKREGVQKVAESAEDVKKRAERQV
ncbi:hypothetical protein DFJ58DRAFT_798160 [Suillus subalutaceus]|uniref:uncharacterized protein n=1 Tax=Suillus subalutaceus TaxID=48586 RepID=UPI001B86BEFD|nr:uncharacterized protein DFJ58DRAFT_798160 [Suillus subalutaceus]KAG1847359.1 hypothetical protein DFJ58DRAFT_798160 [Suillus subalutaceus]